MFSSNTSDGQNKVEFNKATGQFIVKVKLSHDQYGRCCQYQTIADLDQVVFDKGSGDFIVPLSMSPDEYAKYMQDESLPAR